MRSLTAALIPFLALTALSAPALAAEATVSIAGRGEVTAAPDTAFVTSGVTTQGATAREALDANTKAMNELLDTLKAAGIEPRDIQTSGFSVNPNYVYTDARDANGYTLPPKINGYQAVPLDGIWMRAPYLHNGSVPNLTELLEPQEKRSRMFYRGYDVYDPVKVGFDTESDAARQHGFRLDTAERGNGNQGHLYGTALSPADKKALIEYLKTLGPVEGSEL